MTIRERIAELENPVCCPGMDPIGIDEPCIIAIRDRAERIAQLSRLLALVEAAENAKDEMPCKSNGCCDCGTAYHKLNAAISALWEHGDI